MKIKTAVVVAAMLTFSGSGAYAQLPPENGSGSGSASSWVAGIHAGHNWQNDSVVYGIETDLSGTALKTDFNTVLHGVLFPTPEGNTNANIEYYGTVRGRLGWSAGQWLFYGTGGLAYGSLDINSMFGSPFQLGLQMNELRVGWVGGGGIEYKWSPNVIFSLNYQYVDLGRVGFSTVASGPISAIHNRKRSCAAASGDLRRELAVRA
jgi:outer membrane immunogenic protein